jgi:hypothetical protein
MEAQGTVVDAALPVTAVASFAVAAVVAPARKANPAAAKRLAARTRTVAAALLPAVASEAAHAATAGAVGSTGAAWADGPVGIGGPPHQPRLSQSGSAGEARRKPARKPSVRGAIGSGARSGGPPPAPRQVPPQQPAASASARVHHLGVPQGAPSAAGGGVLPPHASNSAGGPPPQHAAAQPHSAGSVAGHPVALTPYQAAVLKLMRGAVASASKRRRLDTSPGIGASSAGPGPSSGPIADCAGIDFDAVRWVAAASTEFVSFVSSEATSLAVMRADASAPGAAWGAGGSGAASSAGGSGRARARGGTADAVAGAPVVVTGLDVVAAHRTLGYDAMADRLAAVLDADTAAREAEARALAQAQAANAADAAAAAQAAQAEAAAAAAAAAAVQSQYGPGSGGGGGGGGAGSGSFGYSAAYQQYGEREPSRPTGSLQHGGSESGPSHAHTLPATVQQSEHRQEMTQQPSFENQQPQQGWPPAGNPALHMQWAT